MNKPRILMVEDEARLAELIRDYLIAAGYEVALRHGGAGVAENVRAEPPDLLLLDLMLPDVDGLTICREVRAFSSLPIIILTARVEEIDCLLGLDLGADDYICKPARPREVVARVRAVLRRSLPADARPEDTRLVLDETRFEARLDGRVLDLTPAEFRLLRHLVMQPGRVWSRDQLLDAIYDDHRVVGDRTIDSHVKNLRRKLSERLGDANPIRSVYGVGYKLEWEGE
ncbi:MAG: response regulator [Ectothiorhodospiraceae bacterium]|jgi:two-component system response regulator BaeR|nr:response regulator [Ectothiorhodospiraceae bacterium]